MRTWDYLIAGGGCAGLSLAYYLVREGLGRQTVLIVDQDTKDRNDRTWCFWTDGPPPFESIIYHSWDRLAFRDARGELTGSLGPFRYHMLRGIDFYRHIRAQLQSHPNVEWLQGRIDAVSEDHRGPYARVDGRMIRARWLFNSCHAPAGKPRPAGRHYALLQHFRGWLIESRDAAFDPRTPTLMDFATPQHGQARFFYVLPLSERRALVEYTVFSEKRLEPVEYEDALRNYIAGRLGIAGYEILETEDGVIPMTDAPPPPPAGPHIVPIGARGGAVKPTTGYAFLRIQQQTRRLAENLLRHGVPGLPPSSPGRFRFYDRLLLHILSRSGRRAAPVFSRLFRRNPLPAILAFLDERTSVGQEAAIFLRLPIGDFLRALWRTYFTGRRLPLPARGEAARDAGPCPLTNAGGRINVRYTGDRQPAIPASPAPSPDAGGATQNKHTRL